MELDASYNSYNNLMSTSHFVWFHSFRYWDIWVSVQILHNHKCYISILLQQIFNTAAVTNQMMQPYLYVQTRF